MKILGIIPARGGSKGIPRKNIKLLKGKPLIQYTIEAANQSKLLTNCIVSTEDKEIAEVAYKLGVEVPFMRPDELAQDDTPTLPVIQHALNYFLDKGVFYDVVCILQATTPFREKGLIDNAIKKLLEVESDALVSVRPVPHEYNPHWVYEPNKEGLLNIATGEKEIITRRQDLPIAFIRDGALYLTKTNVILQQKSLYGNSLSFIENKTNKHVNLDSVNDWNLAEKLFSQNKNM